MRSTLTIVALSGLIGCTGNPDPDPTPAPGINTPSASPSAAPTESGPADTEVEKPKRPAAMDREDADGAAAAAEYFIELYPYVMATGDTSIWHRMSHDSCNFCTELETQAREIKENGERFIGGETSIAVTRFYERDAVTGIFPFDAVVTQEPQRIIAEDGSTVLDASKEELTRRIEMGRESGRWVMINVAPIPNE